MSKVVGSKKDSEATDATTRKTQFDEAIAKLLMSIDDGAEGGLPPTRAQM